MEEQVTVDDLQKIADEVSQTFHRPTWNVVVDSRGTGRSCKISGQSVVVTRAWLATAEPAKLRFGLVLFEVSKAFGLVTASSVVSWGHTIITLTFFVLAPELPADVVPMGLQVVIAIVLLAGFYGKPNLAAFVRRRLISDAFLHRLLEASKDPEAVREYLKREKVSAETLAKFEAMVKAMDHPAQG